MKYIRKKRKKIAYMYFNLAHEFTYLFNMLYTNEFIIKVNEFEI